MSTEAKTAIELMGLGAMLTLWAGLIGVCFHRLWKTFKFELEYLKHPRLVPFDESKVCPDLHTWVEAELVLRGLPPGRYRVCNACGEILGQPETMVSQEVLQHMREALELKKNKDAAEDAVIARINEVANGYIQGYIMREFMDEINKAGNRLEDDPTIKLKRLVDFAYEAQAQARDKVFAEQEAVDDLEKRYTNWPTGRKGNA